MSKKAAHVKIGELKSDVSVIKNLEISIGRIFEDLPIPEAINEAVKGDLSKLVVLYELCVGCARCEGACPEDLPIHNFIVKAAFLLRPHYRRHSNYNEGRDPRDPEEKRMEGG